MQSGQNTPAASRSCLGHKLLTQLRQTKLSDGPGSAKSLAVAIAFRISMAPAATHTATAQHHATTVKNVTVLVLASGSSVEGSTQLGTVTKSSAAGTDLTDAHAVLIC